MKYTDTALHTSFWQSPIWADILQQSHYVADIVHIHTVDSTYQIEIRTIGMGYVAAFCIGCTHIPDTADTQYIQDKIAKYKPLYIQYEPIYGGQYVDKNENIPSSEIYTGEPSIYKNFLEAYTRLIDISVSTQDILVQMHQKGRYNVRLAEKRGVYVEWVAPTPENIDIWMGLLADTLVRDDFGGNSRNYYENFLHAPGVYMAFARLGSDVLAAGIFVQHTDVGIYYYGASTSHADLRKHKAPYLLQYTAMCYMQSLGCTTYDMLGVCPLSDSTHRLYGVSDFKEKFGGEVYMLPPKKMYILRKYVYMLFTIVRRIKGYIGK